MPKQKTHSGAKKRFRTTGSGKLMREKAGHRHQMEHKSSRKARRLEGTAAVAKNDQKEVRRLLGK